MKKGIHPDNYRPVVFKDMSNEEIFITRSTVAAKETIEIDGVTYPLVKLEITSSSHPFFTGKEIIDFFQLYVCAPVVKSGHNSLYRLFPDFIETDLKFINLFYLCIQV